MSARFWRNVPTAALARQLAESALTETCRLVKPLKVRLDVAMAERGIVPSRTKAQALIMARRVLVDGDLVDKPGTPVDSLQPIEIVELEHPYVGRGGMKLAHALTTFGVTVDGRVCADIGASTGGFTDVLLRSGAVKVYAIDVGYGQLDQSLRTDSRVVVREKVNARYLEQEDFDEPVELVTVDVSFIPLHLILPAVLRILAQGGLVIALIKPQFEVGRGEVGKGGIVRDESKRSTAVEAVQRFASENGLTVIATTESPIKGAEGNVEYLMYACKR